MSSVERKVIDVGPNTTNVSTTMTMTLLNGCAPGTGLANRVGRKIQVRSCFVRAWIYLEGTQTLLVSPLSSAGQYVRFILLWDMQPNAAVFTAADLFNNNAIPYSQLLVDNKDRFKILKDKHVTLDPLVYNTTATQSVAGFNRTSSQFKWYVKLNQECVYNSGSAGTIADITTGALYLVTIGSIATGTSDCQLQWTARTRFTDL